MKTSVPFSFHHIDHVLLLVKGVDRALAFYEDALGAEVEARMPAHAMIDLRAGLSRIALVDIDDPRGSWAPLGYYAQPADVARLGDFIELSAEAVRDIPHAKRVVIPECGHIPHLEFPDQFLAKFLPFLRT